MRTILRKLIFNILKYFYPSKDYRRNRNASIWNIKQHLIDCPISLKAHIYKPSQINNSVIGDYTYISQNAIISFTAIGKFCSIGPNLLCGWGQHPLNGISTHPMFYSINMLTGKTFSKSNKIEERLPIKIGNDVFIGANVTILDGVTIGDGAIIGAGAVVSKNIPPYAIAVGCPIIIKGYRFDDTTIQNLLNINWWNFSDDNLKYVEQYFFETEKFIEKFNIKT